MKRAKSAICVIMMMFVISACAGRTSNDSEVSMREQEEIPGEAEETTLTASPENGSNGMPEQEESREKVIVMDELLLSVGDKNLSVEWEDNESVDALKDLAGSEMKINMAMYGGFEQVGSIGTSLPRNDSQMTTSPGDIVLYSGNQIVIFYGSNSWAYTRLGKITGLNEKELEDTFGNGDVTIGLSVGGQTDSEEVRSFDFEDRSVMLNSGYEMPIMGLGTYSLDHDTCVNSVKALLQNGGRLIDTAYMYGNEEAVFYYGQLYWLWELRVGLSTELHQEGPSSISD